MGLSVQPVTFFPVAPVRPVVRSSDEQEPQKATNPSAPAPPPGATPSSPGRLLDIRV